MARDSNPAQWRARQLKGLDTPIRGQVRLVDHRRVSHGLYRRRREGLNADQEFKRDLEAYLLLLPQGAVFTHVTAARLLGWRLPQLPEQVPVFMAVRGDGFHSRRPGLLCSRLTHGAKPGKAHGLPVDSAPEILLRCARELGTLDLLIMVDSALRLGHLKPRELEELLASSRPGVRALRKAYALADRRSESAGETLLRVFHQVLGIEVEPQKKLYDGAGQLIGQVDLLIRGTPFVQEYDGAVHRSGGQHVVDLRRERSWVGTEYQRNGYALDDLLNHAATVIHELDRLLDRPHDRRRLERWRALVEESLYSKTGRARVVNRWRRQWNPSVRTQTA